MAIANRPLVEALRETADRLDSGGTAYRWTHQGACNCGHLAQTLTGRSSAEIHRAALERPGDWATHAVDYCPSSGYRIDDILGQLLDAGLELGDIEHLERLSDPKVRARVVSERTEPSLDFRRRGDVVAYLRAFADLLADRLSVTESGELPAVAVEDAAKVDVA